MWFCLPKSWKAFPDKALLKKTGNAYQKIEDGCKILPYFLILFTKLTKKLPMCFTQNTGTYFRKPGIYYFDKKHRHDTLLCLCIRFYPSIIVRCCSSIVRVPKSWIIFKILNFQHTCPMTILAHSTKCTYFPISPMMLQPLNLHDRHGNRRPDYVWLQLESLDVKISSLLRVQSEYWYDMPFIKFAHNLNLL